MPRPIFAIADVHIANHKAFGGEVRSSINKRCRYTLNVLSDAVNMCHKENGVLVVVGDLFDVTRPEASVIAEVQRILEPVEAILIKGNHDSNSDQPNDHAMAPLRPVATVIEEPTIIKVGTTNLWCAPSDPRQTESWLPDVLGRLAKSRSAADNDALFIHTGISDPKTPKFLGAVKDQIPAHTLAGLCAQHGLTHVFAGNWHNRKDWKISRDGLDVHIQQIGALVPTGWDNEGLHGYGGVAKFHAQKTTMIEVPGPRFIKVRGDLEDVRNLLRKVKDSSLLYIKVLCSPDSLTDTTEFMAELVTRGIIAAQSVVVDKVYRTAAAHSAAHSARNAENADKALEYYINRMPLGDKLMGLLSDGEEQVFREKLINAARELISKVSSDGRSR